MLAQRETRWHVVVRGLSLLRVHLDARHAAQSEVAECAALYVARREVPVRAHEEEPVRLHRPPRALATLDGVVLERDNFPPSERVTQPLERSDIRLRSHLQEHWLCETWCRAHHVFEHNA